ncbi:hypothetical protein F5884DRAFT_769561 [Xylogone sp. PMI_703]|nr:hypothetical protein F5884DRAFT_769561 [Xylogone sp. PMI_703]
MSTSFEVETTLRVVTTAAAASEKRKQQNRAAQKTYREKRKRKLQELEALASSSGLLPLASTSDSSTNAATDQVDDVHLAPQFSLVEHTTTDAGAAAYSDDLFFEFISPAAVDFSPSPSTPARPIPPQTTSINYKIPFPKRPTAGQCDELARVVLAAFTRGQGPLARFDPYLNHLNIAILSFAASFFANALHLGLIESEFCHQTAQSNFYRPKITESPYAETMVLAVQRGFEGLKPDLRPTRTQITQSHHPAIDVLPFPSMRRGLIEALSHDPPLVNESEFWEDLRADGIVCWGDTSRELHGCGVPWDARSWEAKPWFLDKWRCILGGEDGELWQASRWWREVRGEFI